MNFKIIVGGLVVISVLFSGCQRNSSSPTPSVREVKFYSDNYFKKSLSEMSPDTLPNITSVSGGIVPHDIFPGFMMARFFNILSKSNPKTVVIIGPNHFELGDSKVITSNSSWKTAFGTIAPNEKIIQSLLKTGLVKNNDEVVENDHATTSVMPYLNYFLPNTLVVPIMLSKSITESEISSIAAVLKPEEDKGVVVIAATDFSHYLRSEIAESKDKETLQSIEAGDYRQILAFGNDHVDSPPSLVLLMKSINPGKFEVIDHTNSGKILNNNYMETTSYFSIIFKK